MKFFRFTLYSILKSTYRLWTRHQIQPLPSQIEKTQFSHTQTHPILCAAALRWEDQEDAELRGTVAEAGRASSSETRVLWTELDRPDEGRRRDLCKTIQKRRTISNRFQIGSRAVKALSSELLPCRRTALGSLIGIVTPSSMRGTTRSSWTRTGYRIGMTSS